MGRVLSSKLIPLKDECTALSDDEIFADFADIRPGDLHYFSSRKREVVKKKFLIAWGTPEQLGAKLVAVATYEIIDKVKAKRLHERFANSLEAADED